MYKSKILSSLLVGLLILGQSTPIFATGISKDLTEHQGTSNNHANWDEIEYGGTGDDSYVSPDYYPDDHEIYGGYPGTRDEGSGSSGGNSGNNNGGSNGNGNGSGNNNGKFDDIRQTTQYKIKNNSCYLITTSSINGSKEKTTEKKVDMHLCLGAGGTVGGKGTDGGENSVGNIDPSKLIIYPTAPGEGANIQDVAEVIGESDAREAETSTTYEIIYDENEKVIGVRHKETGKEYKVGEKIIVGDNIVIGVVKPDGTIDSSESTFVKNENGNSTKDGKVSTIKNDLEGLGKDTHGLYYTLDKSRGDSSLIYLDIKVKEDKTVTHEEFISALTTVTNANNGKIVKDEGRTLFFLEGQLMMVVNPSDNVSIELFGELFNKFDSGIFVKPLKK